METNPDHTQIFVADSRADAIIQQCHRTLQLRTLIDQHQEQWKNNVTRWETLLQRSVSKRFASVRAGSEKRYAAICAILIVLAARPENGMTTRQIYNNVGRRLGMKPETTASLLSKLAAEGILELDPSVTLTDGDNHEGAWRLGKEVRREALI